MILTAKQCCESTGPTPLFMEILPKLILEQYQKLTCSLEDFPAKTYQTLEEELALRGIRVHSGNIIVKPLGKYCQDTHSLRTFQHSLIGDSTLSLVTLP